MKLGRLFCFSILFGVSAIVAYGQTPVDPKVIFEKDPGAPVSIVTPDFTISSPTGDSPGTSACGLAQGSLMNTSPSCSFKDEINLNGVKYGITQLVFDIAITPDELVTCGLINLADFSTCSVVTMDDGTLAVVTFSGGLIKYNTSFALSFDGFPPNTDFGGAASLTPEPNSLILMLTGAVLLFVGWKRKRTSKRQPLAT
jgi:hypothetical protein